MKIRIFLQTFLVYTLLNTTRGSYSFAKFYIKKDYQLSNIFLAILDASIYFGLGLAFSMRYLLSTSPKLTRKFMIYSFLSVITYTLLPGLSFINIHHSEISRNLVILFMFAYGFFQFKYLPTCLALLNHHFTTQKHGCLLGLWSACRNVGSIVGYYGTSFFILNLNFEWQFPLLFFSAILLIMNIFLIYTLKSHEQNRVMTNETKIQEVEEQQQKITCCQYLLYVKNQLLSLEFIIFVLTLCFLKAIMYTLFLWLPIYMKAKGYESQIAFTITIFSLSGILGSFIIGKFYETNEEESHPKCLHGFLVSLGCVIVVAIILIVLLNPFSHDKFMILIGILGFSVGGIHNIYESNQTLRINKGNTHTLVMFTNLVNGIANLFIGVIQLIMGLFLVLSENDNSKETHQQYDIIFDVLMGVSFLLFVLLISKKCSTTKKSQKMVRIEPQSLELTVQQGVSVNQIKKM